MSSPMLQDGVLVRDLDNISLKLGSDSMKLIDYTKDTTMTVVLSWKLRGIIEISRTEKKQEEDQFFVKRLTVAEKNREQDFLR